MAKSYHLKRGNKINGPFSIEELRKLFKSQKLKSDDRLAQSSEGPWQRLADVLTEFGDSQTPRSSDSSASLQDGAAVDQSRRKNAKTPSTRKGVQHAQSDEDDFMSALSSAVSQTAKMPAIEEESLETEAKPTKSKKRSQDNESFSPLSALLSIYEDNKPFSQVAIFLMVFVAGTVGAVALMKQMATHQRSTREQQQFAGKTTGTWLELEARGKARQSEVLWRDSRWTPLVSVLGLDFAALPEVLSALANDSTRQLALAILEKPPHDGTNGPYFEDLETGLRHSNPLVSLWAARMAAFYKGEVGGGTRVSEIMAMLETIASSGDRDAATAALETVTLLKNAAN